MATRARTVPHHDLAARDRLPRVDGDPGGLGMSENALREAMERSREVFGRLLLNHLNRSIQQDMEVEITRALRCIDAALAAGPDVAQDADRVERTSTDERTEPARTPTGRRSRFMNHEHECPECGGVQACQRCGRVRR